MSNNGVNFHSSANPQLTYTSTVCDVGREAATYYDECTLCSPGFFDADVGRTTRPASAVTFPIQCSPCPFGEYQDEIGSTESCKACPAGTTSLGKDLDGAVTQIVAASNRSRDCTCQNAEHNAAGDSFYKSFVEVEGGMHLEYWGLLLSMSRGRHL